MKWLDKSGWYGLDTIAIIEFQPDNLKYRVLVMGNRKKSLLILEKQVFDSPQELKPWLDKYPLIPIILDLSNCESISRVIHGEVDDLVSRVMRVEITNTNDFIAQTIQSKKEAHWATILRKEKLEEVFGFIDIKRVIYQNLTKATNAFLLPLIDEYDETLHYCLEDAKDEFYWHDGLETESLEEPIALSRKQLSEKLELDQAWVELFGIGVYYFLVEKLEPQIQSEFHKAQNYFQKIKIGCRLAGMGLLIGGILLLSSLGIKQYVTYRWAKFSTLIAQNQASFEELENNQSQITDLTHFLNEFHKNGPNYGRISYIFDQIAAQIPVEVSLEKLYFRPSSQKIKKLDSDLKNEAFDLVLKGESQKSSAISQLAINLHNLPIIEEAELFSNQFHYQSKNHHFIIILQLNQK